MNNFNARNKANKSDSRDYQSEIFNQHASHRRTNKIEEEIKLNQIDTIKKHYEVISDKKFQLDDVFALIRRGKKQLVLYRGAANKRCRHRLINHSVDRLIAF